MIIKRIKAIRQTKRIVEGWLKREYAGQRKSINACGITKVTPALEIPNEVKRLPIPKLEKTMERYLAYIKPLVEEEQYRKTEQKVKAFEEKQAKELQEDLEKLDEESETSYLEGFWDSLYLDLRCPNPVNVNPAFMLTHREDIYKDQYKTAAHIIKATYDLHKEIEEKGIVPDPPQLCKSQYRNLFATARVPKQGRDELLKYPNQNHFIVMHNQNIYSVEVRKETTIKTIENTLRNQLNTQKGKDHIGVFTAQERDEWANVRVSIVKTHEIELETIDAAIAVIVLDNQAFDKAENANKILLCSESTQRWYDKLQVIISPTGHAGINMEHTGFDGLTLLGYAKVLHEYQEKTQQVTDEGDNTSVQLEHIQFENAHIAPETYEKAKEQLIALDQGTAHHTLTFTQFGKKEMKTLKTSPDAFVQIAFQLAYGRLRNTFGSTYESVMTKHFYHGRTETQRPATEALRVFCQEKMDKENISNEEKRAAYEEAVTAQVQRIKECQQGEGVDRHLYALHQLAIHREQRLSGYEVPNLFSDLAYTTMKTDMLSTSNCSSPYVDLFCFGATSAKGFGIGYIIRDDRIIFGVSDYQQESSAYVEALEQALLDLQTLLKAT